MHNAEMKAEFEAKSAEIVSIQAELARISAALKQEQEPTAAEALRREGTAYAHRVNKLKDELRTLMLGV